MFVQRAGVVALKQGKRHRRPGGGAAERHDVRLLSREDRLADGIGRLRRVMVQATA